MQVQPLLPLGYERTMVELRHNRQTVGSIAAKFGVSQSFVRRVLKANGVKLTAHRKLTQEAYEQLLADIKAEQPYVALAAKYGISRERVRQYAASLGMPSLRQRRQERKRQRLKERKQLRVQRQRKRHASVMDRYKTWSELWKKGCTAVEMAEALGLTSANAILVRMCTLRKLYPDMFPYRNQPGA